MIAAIRPASYGIRNARGYLLYWESETSTYQALDSWTIYTSVAAARTAAQQKQPGIKVEQR